MHFSRLIQLFTKFGNANDIVHLVCDSDYSVLWSGKVKDLKKSVPFIKSECTGFSSRLFNPKTNSFEDGFYIYVTRTIVI